MARRSLLETAITNCLHTKGWNAPSLRVQEVAFPGVTPAHSSKGGSGRGSVVLDVERVDTAAGFLVANVAGIKAGAKRKTTVTITTGKPAHLNAVIQAAENGLDIPVVIVAMKAEIKGKGENAVIIDHGSIEATVINVGQAIRTYGLQQRTVGQGKGRGQAHPVSYGIKRQKAASGKTYEYVSLSVNLAGCGAAWSKISNLADLAEFIEQHSEGIYL